MALTQSRIEAIIDIAFRYRENINYLKREAHKLYLDRQMDWQTKFEEIARLVEANPILPDAEVTLLLEYKHIQRTKKENARKREYMQRKRGTHVEQYAQSMHEQGLRLDHEAIERNLKPYYPNYKAPKPQPIVDLSTPLPGWNPETKTFTGAENHDPTSDPNRPMTPRIWTENKEVAAMMAEVEETEVNDDDI